MSDAIKKFLAKVSAKERKLIVGIIEKILVNDTSLLQIKKLSGSKDIFRARKGNFRIIYKRTSSDCKIISIEHRNESTYKGF